MSSFSSPSTTSSSKRRSARVQKRDPIVAPGFGTLKDLHTLASSLNLPVPAVQAIMESRGRGIRSSSRAKRDSSEATATAAAPATPISTAWADFMTEEGMSGGSNQQDSTTTAATANDSKQAAAVATTTTTTTSSDKPRDYILPLVAKWNQAVVESTTPKKKKAKTSTPPPSKEYLLVQSGTLDSAIVGRSRRILDKPYDCIIPTSIMPSLKVTKVIASCNGAHALVLDAHGHAYGWGRNEAHQLTQSLPSVVPLPTLLDFEHGSVVDAAVGKSHTILLTCDKTMYAVGLNKSGQCGVRNFAEVPNFRKCVLDGVGGGGIVQVSCGEAFTVALSEDGHVYTTGSSEFGQLGNGDTGEYIVTAGKSGFANCNIFTKRDVFCHVLGEMHHAGMASGNDSKVVPMNEKIRIGYIACGKHHTVAIEAPVEGGGIPPRVWTWGCGNYGCLGHGVQQDEYHPRLVATLSSGPLWQSNPPVSAAAGSSCTMILTERGHVYYCGRHRSVGEAVMRPTLLEALANNGHVVTHMAAGSSTVVCTTTNAVTISWGSGLHGELGYGEKKSSAKPDFISTLDSCRVCDLACGQGTTLFAIADEDADDKKAIKKLPVLDAKSTKALEK